jgi:hypothetical protein
MLSKKRLDFIEKKLASEAKSSMSAESLSDQVLTRDDVGMIFARYAARKQGFMVEADGGSLYYPKHGARISVGRPYADRKWRMWATDLRAFE